MAPFSQSSCNAGDSMVYYKPLKEGRAQGMQACLTDGGFDYTDKDGTFQIGNETLIVGTPTFPKTTENTPPGAESGSGMDRGHLLARILGGDGDDRRNLVPLYPKANQKVMKKFEAMVNSTTRSDQHTVWYSVTPMYDGSDVPIGLAVAWADVTSGDADTFFLPNSRR